MPLIAVLAAGMTFGLIKVPMPQPVKAPSVRHELVRIGHWRLDIARDNFADTLTCRLGTDDGRLTYQAGAVGFRFDRDWNVREAVYRLDGATPIATREDVAVLLQRGTPFDAGGLDNPSQGVVWIPAERVAAARVVAIAPRPELAPRTFRYPGLAQIHARAVERGCAPEARFVAP